MLDTITIFDDEPAPKNASVRRITDIKESAHDRNRVNIYINDGFFCSLDISQVVDLHLKIGLTVTAEQSDEIMRASDFGKFYTRALEYILLRPRSSKEIRDYLKKKTLDTKVRVKNRKTDTYEVRIKKGYDSSLAPLVFERLEKRGYIDDYKFAKLWVENRNVSKGTSVKKLRLELAQKGISESIVEQVLHESTRSDESELAKIIAKKRNRYPDRDKLVQYLLRAGFDYSDIVDALSDSTSASSGA